MYLSVYLSKVPSKVIAAVSQQVQSSSQCPDSRVDEKMAGVELKIQILRKSMSSFGSWLDDCDQLLTSIPTELEQCSAPELRGLALKYKVCS